MLIFAPSLKVFESSTMNVRTRNGSALGIPKPIPDTPNAASYFGNTHVVNLSEELDLDQAADSTYSLKGDRATGSAHL